MNLYAYVANDPVNFVDPWGLVSAGQLGIGNPGSYGGENTCESMNDDTGLEGWNSYWQYQYIAPTPEEYLAMAPIGGVGGKLGQVGRGLIGKPFPTKPGYMGKAQPYNPSNGRYLSPDANPGIAHSPLARFGAGFTQGWAESKGATGATPVGKAGNLGYMIGNTLGNLF